MVTTLQKDSDIQSKSVYSMENEFKMSISTMKNNNMEDEFPIHSYVINLIKSCMVKEEKMMKEEKVKKQQVGRSLN